MKRPVLASGKSINSRSAQFNHSNRDWTHLTNRIWPPKAQSIGFLIINFELKMFRPGDITVCSQLPCIWLISAAFHIQFFKIYILSASHFSFY